MDVEEALRTLGLRTGASPAEIKAAYRGLLKSCHPDRVGGDEGRVLEAEQRTRRIIAAYQALARPTRYGTMPAAPSEAEWFALPIWVQLDPLRRRRPAYPCSDTTWDRIAIPISLLFALVMVVLDLVLGW